MVVKTIGFLNLGVNLLMQGFFPAGFWLWLVFYIIRRRRICAEAFKRNRLAA
jgi:hypothetical protein